MHLDNYCLEKVLGKGAFGEVYLTTKKDSKNLYATKKIERTMAEKGVLTKYFANEIQIMKELNHPNIAKFEAVKKTPNHFYVIMEYCNGGELSKALELYMEKYKRPFTQEIVQYLMRQIIDAFKYIHGKSILHRDIKLDNILLNYENEEDKKNLNLLKAQVKIIDFGFSAKIDKTGLKYTTLGSPINMDPLILGELTKRGKKTRKLGYDQKADIWSLGTICYEMLIGKSVFNAEDLDDLVEKVEKGTYTVPTTLSKEIISFLNGMLQYEPNSRLNIEQLSKHIFLNKNARDFEKIDMKKVSPKNVENNELKINVKKNKSIWAIFNKEDEDKLIKINAQGNDKPIGEEEKTNFRRLNSNAIGDKNTYFNNIMKNNNFNNNINNLQTNNININNNPYNNMNGNNLQPNNFNNNGNNLINNLNNFPNNNLVNNRNSMPNSNNLNNNINTFPNNNLINNGNMIPNNNLINNPNINNGYQPMVNYPPGYMPQNNQMTGYYGYHRTQTAPMPGMTMPVMGYQQAPQMNGYAMNSGYAYPQMRF